MNRHEAEQANQKAFEAFTREDVPTLLAQMRRAAAIYGEIGETDKQFKTLTAYVGFVGSREPETARRLIEEAERLLPALEGRNLSPLNEHTQFWQTPDAGLPGWPDAPYQQRVTEIERLKWILELEAAPK